MRKIICREGVEDLGHIFEVGSLQWSDPLPLVWNFSHDNIGNVLGRAEDIRREENGEITAEIVFNDSDKAQQARTTLENKDTCCTIFANKIYEKRITVGEDEEAHAVRLIKSATIREVSVILAAGHPWN
jgi:hypothetical protein